VEGTRGLELPFSFGSLRSACDDEALAFNEEDIVDVWPWWVMAEELIRSRKTAFVTFAFTFALRVAIFLCVDFKFQF